MSVNIQDAVSAIRKFAPNFNAKVGMILGSGLGAIAEQLTNPITIPYQAIPGLMASGVSGHASLMVLGYFNDIPVVCMKGRLHRYEGASYESIGLLVRLIKQMGASSVVITAAAGSMREEVGPGEVMMITDHINFQPGNPLVGHNDESIGPRFVSLENAYDEGLRDNFAKVATRLNIPLYEGTYISLLGPSFETPAEIRAYRSLGADAVGMSVVSEVILARHCGLRVLGVAAITNLAVGLSQEKVTHEMTLQFADVAARKLTKLIPEYIKGLASDI